MLANHDDVLSTNLLFFTYLIPYREDFLVSIVYSLSVAFIFHYIIYMFVSLIPRPSFTLGKRRGSGIQSSHMHWILPLLINIVLP